MSSAKQPQVNRRPAAQRSTGKGRGFISTRAILLGILLSIINDFWVVKLEVQRQSMPTAAAPFYTAVFTLLIITAANFGVRKLRPNLAFSRAELLTNYVMVSISSAVCSRQMLQILLPLMTHAFFFQTPDNNYAGLFLDKLPSWLTVRDPVSLHNFYFGNSSLYMPENYLPWILPALRWCAFGAVLLFTMLCLNSILRKQWVESERLTFPIVMLPLEMTDESGSFFRNRLMWIGFGIAGGLTLLSGLNYLWPTIPCFPIARRNYGNLITNPPWNAIGNVPVGFYFWAIGLAFLMPLELSFSCWIFFWLTKFEMVGCAMLGMESIKVTGGGLDTSFPFLGSQAYGAYIGFFLMSIWSSRGFLKRVWRTAIHGTGEEDESREALSYRAAFIGAALGLIAMGIFIHLVGISIWLVPVFLACYLLIAVVATRIRAELGFPVHDIRGMGPQYSMLSALGTEHMPRSNLVGFTMLGWFNNEYSSHPAPHQMESFKLSERSDAPAKQMFKAAAIAGTIAMPIGFWILLHTFFGAGAGTSHVVGWGRRFGGGSYDQLADWLTNPFSTNHMSLAFVGLGLIVSVAMGWMRMRYLWFPLHPLAYAIGFTWGVVQLWMPLFIGSVVKYLMLKFGGLPTYRRSLPFFFGLILGEIVVGSLWTLIGIAFGIPTYDFWPGVMAQ